MRTYRVVMVIARFPPIIGGTEIQCQELSQALARRGHSVTVLTERYSRELPACETIGNVSVRRLGRGGPQLLASLIFGIQTLAWLLMHGDFDIVHAHMLAGPAIAALAAAGLLKKPVVVKIAGAGPTGDIGTSAVRKRGRLKLALFKRFRSFVVCPSPITFQELQALGILAARLRLVPNGVNTERFQPPSPEGKRQVREALLPKLPGPLAVFVGRWADGKGVEELLQVWESGQKRADFHWLLQLVVQREPTAAQQARIQALGHRVRWTAGVKDTLPYYQAADLAVLLSENEGLSNFLLEAMSCGLPLMTSPAAAVGPENEAGAWSWRVSPREPEAIVEALIAIEQDPASLSARGTAAHRKALEAFSSDRVAQAYEQVYEDVSHVRNLRRR